MFFLVFFCVCLVYDEKSIQNELFMWKCGNQEFSWWLYIRTTYLQAASLNKTKFICFKFSVFFYYQFEQTKEIIRSNNNINKLNVCHHQIKSKLSYFLFFWLKTNEWTRKREEKSATQKNTTIRNFKKKTQRNRRSRRYLQR